MTTQKQIPLIVGFGAVAVATTCYGIFAMWPGIGISVQLSNVVNLLAPLALTAAFIERAVEVVITPWRDAQTAKLHINHQIVKADPTATSDQKQSAANDLTDYKGETTQYAFAIALALGLAAAMVGVRALWPFLTGPQALDFKDHGTPERNAFIVFDVILSGALMAGGANGIHSIVNSMTTFFDTTSQKAQQSANTAPGGPAAPGGNPAPGANPVPNANGNNNG